MFKKTRCWNRMFHAISRLYKLIPVLGIVDRPAHKALLESH